MKRPELQRDYDCIFPTQLDGLWDREWRDLNYKGITTSYRAQVYVPRLVVNEETWTTKGLRRAKFCNHQSRGSPNEETWTTKGLRLLVLHFLAPSAAEEWRDLNYKGITTRRLCNFFWWYKFTEWRDLNYKGITTRQLSVIKLSLV